MLCVNRQYSTESQQSANYVHSNSIKEKEVPKSNIIGEKLIETEKAETGSVCITLIFRKIYMKHNLHFYEEKEFLFYMYILYFFTR